MLLLLYNAPSSITRSARKAISPSSSVILRPPPGPVRSCRPWFSRRAVHLRLQLLVSLLLFLSALLRRTGRVMSGEELEALGLGRWTCLVARLDRWNCPAVDGIGSQLDAVDEFAPRSMELARSSMRLMNSPRGRWN